jgi:hypothetical protein
MQCPVVPWCCLYGFGWIKQIVFIERDGVPGAIPLFTAQWFECWWGSLLHCFRQHGVCRPAGGVVELLIVIPGFAYRLVIDVAVRVGEVRTILEVQGALAQGPMCSCMIR